MLTMLLLAAACARLQGLPLVCNGIRFVGDNVTDSVGRASLAA
jgi:hypothetical protein